MAATIKQLADFYDYVFVYLGDDRSKDLPLIQSPLPVLLLLICYVYFVTNLGPRLMKSRQPFNLRKVMIVYNTCQILVNAFIFFEAGRNGWIGEYNWICAPMDWEDTPHNKYVTRLVYLYFAVKIIDLLDTVSNISKGGHGTFVGFINAFVHAVMYGYYLFSTLNPNHSGKIWWKKYLTQLQMAQFLMVAVHISLLLFQPNCNYPKFTVFVLMPQNIFMFFLFCEFYKKTYLTPKSSKACTNGVSKSNGNCANGITKSPVKDHVN